MLEQSGMGASDEAASIDLVIAERIIEAHGGTLEVERGRTMLRFDLPLSGPSAAAAASTVAGKDASAASW